jgi:hypothetical protein
MPNPRRAFAPQIELPKPELTRLISRIEDDYQGAIWDHDARMRRFTAYYARWRDLASDPPLGQERKPNFRVPLLQWQTYAKWAKELDSLFGENAEIVAEAVGPSDHRRVHKVALFENWRVFTSMRIVQPAALFSFRKILFGHTHAYAPWERRTFLVPMDDGSWEEQVDYEGPAFEPLWPDDLIVPAEDAHTIQDFSFVLHKFRLTPDQLLRGEAIGKFQGIDEIFEDVLRYAEGGRERDYQSDTTKLVSDEAEGVVRDSLSTVGSLRVWAWYGRWRRLLGKRDARVDNVKYRDKFESDLLVYYVPDLHRIVGVQDLAEMYPTSPRRRPFVESALVRDGSYWGPSFGELLERIELEWSNAHNMGSKAGALSVGPVVFYKPDSGFDPDTFEYEPNTAVAVENPAGINIVQFRADLNYPVMVGQEMGATSERVTGVTDQNLGRQSDRPNAPRTARQFIGLLEEGNVRASLDVKMLREDWRDILSWFWALETMYGSPKTFFRVTEEEARGLFEVSQGGAWLTSQERQGKYDFALKLASSAQSREVDKERQLQLYGLDMQNPLVVNNPRALWVITHKVHEALGDPNFADVIPEPPNLGQPQKPKDEWVALLQGEDVIVHPEDLDEDHLNQHYRQLSEYQQTPGDEVDQQAMQALSVHIAAHHKQLQQKRLMSALTNQLVTNLAQNIGTGQGLQPGGMPMSLQNLQQTIAGLTGGNPNAPGGAPGAPGGPTMPGAPPQPGEPPSP